MSYIMPTIKMMLYSINNTEKSATCTREKKYKYNDSGIITGRRMIIINASLKYFTYLDYQIISRILV